MRLRPSLLVSLLVLTASCGSSSDPGSSVDAGYNKLNSGEHSAALSDFDSALAGMQSSDERFLEAKLGQLRAQCYVDPSKAKADFLALGSGAGLQAKDYRMLVTDLVAAATAKAKSGNEADAKQATATIMSAVAILQAGKTSYPDDDKWDALVKKVGDKATTLGAADALSSLSGLGYVGGD